MTTSSRSSSPPAKPPKQTGSRRRGTAWHPHYTRQVEAFALFFKLVTGRDLEPYQRLIVYEVFAAPSRARILVVIPRGNGKTTLFAALALWQLAGTVVRPGVYFAASTKDQARIAFNVAARFVEGNERLSRRFAVKHGYAEIRRRQARLEMIKVLSSEGGSAHGIENLSLGLVDELHAARDGSLYEALVTGMMKRPDAKLVSITTVGNDLNGKLAEMWAALDDMSVERHAADSEYGAVRIHRSADRSFIALVWALTEHDDLADADVLKTVNPASWLDVAFLQQQIDAPDVHPVSVAKFHANVWMAGDTDWLPAGAWDAVSAQALGIPTSEAQCDPGSPVWLGVDIGLTNDHSAIIRLGYHPQADHILIPQLTTFHAEWGQRVRYSDVRAQIDIELDTYDVQGIAFDRWAFASEAERIEDETGIMVVPIPANHSVMVPATKDLYDDIISELIIHDGDEVLASHMTSAAVRDTPYGLRLDKGRGRRPNDGAYALVCAHREARANGFDASAFDIEILN